MGASAQVVRTIMERECLFNEPLDVILASMLRPVNWFDSIPKPMDVLLVTAGVSQRDKPSI